jgi:phage terminase small subunit
LAECAEAGTLEWRRLRSAANEALSQVLRLSQRFGLTPADRAGLHVEKEDKPQESGKSRFFFGAN